MKIGRERLPVFVDHWASIAISTGSGYVLLSALKSGVATPIALFLLVVGLVVRLVIKYRRKTSL
jgi:hypothetical protein